MSRLSELPKELASDAGYLMSSEKRIMMMVMVMMMELTVMVMVTVVMVIVVMMTNAQPSLCPALSLALSDTTSFKAHRNPMSRYCYDSFSQMRKLSPL